MKYWQARKLSTQKFKRLYGIEKKTCRLMIRLLKDQAKYQKQTGRPPKLIIENQVLITLQRLGGKIELTIILLKIGKFPSLQYAE